MAAWSLGIPLGSPGVGACACAESVGGLTVDSKEIQDLDAQIQQLNTDVNSASPGFDSHNGELMNRMLEWQAFMSRWTTWRIAHTSFLEQTAVPLLGNPEVGPEFEAFVSEYNERLRQWKAGGLPTGADKSHAGQTILDRAVDTVGTVGTVAAIGALAWIGFTIYQSTKGR